MYYHHPDYGFYQFWNTINIPGKLSEAETFELQQHLLTNLHRLEEPEKNLLKELSQNAK